MHTLITSSENSHFKRWRSLRESKGIKKHQQFMASGVKFIADNQQLFSKNSEWLITEGIDAPSDFPGKIYKLSIELFNQLDEFGTHQALFIGDLPPLPEWNPQQDDDGLHIICPLGDPANLGALVRTAQAFACKSLILTRESAHPFLPKVIRSSAGTVLNAPLFVTRTLSEVLNSPVANFFALDFGGQNLQNFNWPKKSYLLMGEEGPGLPPHNLPIISIPIAKTVESLNAVIATSLAIYDFNKKL
ncbi:MAG: RNA methyltransferase [Bdellovibrionales bacterium]|nr:RNA methyltransferase [Bdellovibrionales bacterium]